MAFGDEVCPYHGCRIIPFLQIAGCRIGCPAHSGSRRAKQHIAFFDGPRGQAAESAPAPRRSIPQELVLPRRTAPDRASVASLADQPPRGWRRRRSSSGRLRQRLTASIHCVFDIVVLLLRLARSARPFRPIAHPDCEVLPGFRSPSVPRAPASTINRPDFAASRRFADENDARPRPPAPLAGSPEYTHGVDLQGRRIAEAHYQSASPKLPRQTTSG